MLKKIKKKFNDNMNSNNRFYNQIFRFNIAKTSIGDKKSKSNSSVVNQSTENSYSTLTSN